MLGPAAHPIAKGFGWFIAWEMKKPRAMKIARGFVFAPPSLVFLQRLDEMRVAQQLHAFHQRLDPVFVALTFGVSP